MPSTTKESTTMSHIAPAFDFALASMLDGYAKSAPSPTTVAAVVKAATNAHIVPTVPTSDLKVDIAPTIEGEVGTLSARGFLKIAASANVCWRGEKEQNTHTTPVKGAKYEDLRQALGAYIGFNPATPVGDQLLFATRRAQQEVNPKCRPNTDTAPTMSVVGYISAMEREMSVKVGDLKARIKIATAAIVDFAKVGQDTTLFAKAVNEHLDTTLEQEVRDALIARTTADNVVEAAAKCERDARCVLSALQADLATL
jgi:hypothetical protein